MASQVYTTFSAADNGIQGTVHTLSDGTVLTAFRNQTSIDLVYSADRSAWTLKAAYIAPSWDSSIYVWASALDESDNLHFVWVDTGSNIKYVKFTKSAGPAWTVGTPETVGAYTTGSGWMHSDPRIECMDSGAVLVAWHEIYVPDSATTAASCRFNLRTTGSSWVQFSDSAALQPSGPVQSLAPDCIAIARDSAGAVASQQAFAYVLGGSATASVKLAVKVVNISTGAVVSTTVIDSAVFGSAASVSMQRVRLFSPSPGRWRGFGWRLPSTLYAFQCSNTAYTIQPSTKAVPISTYQGYDFTYTLDRGALVWYNPNTGSLHALIAAFTDTVITWLAPYRWVAVTAATVLGGGGNRNFSYQKAEVVYRTGSTVVWHHSSGLPEAVPIAPTSIKPVAGSVVNTSTPTAECYPYVYNNDPRKARWNFRNSLGPVVVLDQPDSAYASPATFAARATQKVLSTSPLHQPGSWYASAWAVDPWGIAGTQSAEQSFTVSHPPAPVNIFPSGGQTVSWGAAGDVLVAWDFSDPWDGDSQTACQVVVSRNDTGAVLVDTGKVASAVHSAHVTVPSANRDMVLGVKVRLWDLDDVGGSYSPVQLFMARLDPVVTVTAPTGTVATPFPAVSWSVAATGRTQASFQVVFTNTGTGASLGTPILPGSSSSFTSSGVPRLANNSNYTVTVRVNDSEGLGGSGTGSFATSWAVPAAPAFTADASFYFSRGYMKVIWTNAAKDSQFYSWRVYRRAVGDTAWTLLYENQFDLASYEYDDYFALPGIAYEYAVVQVAYRFSVPTESVFNASATGTLVHEDYWLLHPTDSSLHVRLHSVKQESYADEYESGDMNLIGRGRKKDYGTHWGIRGTLSAQIRDFLSPATGLTVTARAAKRQLEALKAQAASVGAVLFIRNPFGDLWQVALDDLAVDRVAGVGGNEYVDVKVPYAAVV